MFSSIKQSFYQDLTLQGTVKSPKSFGDLPHPAQLLVLPGFKDLAEQEPFKGLTPEELLEKPELQQKLLTRFTQSKAGFILTTRSGNDFLIFFKRETSYEILGNLDGLSRGGAGKGDLQHGRQVIVETTTSQEGARFRVEANRIVFLGAQEGRFVFEEASWWPTQICRMADRWLDNLFGSKLTYTANDFSLAYRTNLSLLGLPMDDNTQECATLSRLIYGFASAFLLTGNERHFNAAKAGVEFQRSAFRTFTPSGKYVVWFSSRKLKGGSERAFTLNMGSSNGDDYGLIPLYEQIYALAGLTQFFRISQDLEVLADISRTVGAFQEYFWDPKKQGPAQLAKGFPGTGGYYSHLDPATLLPNAPTMPASNRAKKNWNSIGDHIPAYLINLLLALDPLPELPEGMTEDLRRFRALCLDILDETSDLILEHFPDPQSLFVNERFFEDWRPDHRYSWQQNRAVVGHNYKIAWNLTRVGFYYQTHAKRCQAEGLTQEEEAANAKAARCNQLAQDIIEKMSKVGLDTLRGGIFDCVERQPSNSFPTEFAWRSTKDFWQQEQAILAYYIRTGTLGREQSQVAEDLSLARECSAFWNTFFLDRDHSGVYFRTNADGQPILTGQYGIKGGHAISGYHAFELSYLAHIYSRSFVVPSYEGETTFALHFSIKDQRLESVNVLPDFSPPGHLKISYVRANGVDVTSQLASDPFKFQLSLKRLNFKDKGPLDLTVGFSVTTPPAFPALPPKKDQSAPLKGKKIAVMVESEYIPLEISTYQRRFAAYGAKVELISNLYNNYELSFFSTVNPPETPEQEHLEVTHDLAEVDETEYSAIIVAANYPSVRMRWNQDATHDPKLVREAPAPKFFARAFQNKDIIKGLPCHALWILSPYPELLLNRRVTCNPVVLPDVLNAGGHYVTLEGDEPWDLKIVLDDDLITNASMGTQEAADKFVDAVVDGILRKEREKFVNDL